MNIFFIDSNPATAAKYQCDRHCVKMILETSQMLSTAMHILNLSGAPYLQTHANHPTSKWSRANKNTYLWTCNHLEALLNEYFERYGKIHKCNQYLQLFYDQAKFLPDGEFSDPPQCMPEQYRGSDTVTAYRKYYIGEKASFAKWRNGNIPEWFSCASK